MILWLDLETFSEVPLRNGVYAYAERAEILLFAYALDDGPVSVWDCTQQPNMPAELKNVLADGSSTIVMHNSGFDRVVLRLAFGIDIPCARIHDTFVRALAHSLPGGLGKLCEVLQVPLDKAKDKRGHDLIQLLCKPLAANRKLHRATRETHPKEWAEFVEYAVLDIEAMREIAKRLPGWNYARL